MTIIARRDPAIAGIGGASAFRGKQTAQWRVDRVIRP